MIQKRVCFLCAIICFFCSASIFAEEVQFYSQRKQDAYLYKNVFKDKRHGIFVDIGANDGITLSNTYFFEKFMGWTGICIEPIPEIFARLQANRKCTCVKGCIAETAGVRSFLRVHSRAYGTEMLSGLLEKYDPRHVERIKREIARSGGSSEVLSVQCYTLNQLLVENHIQHIDYLTIDTEGGELDILRSIDFSKLDIDVIDVENNYKDSSFQQFLEPLGYKKIATLAPDEIYKKVRKE